MVQILIQYTLRNANGSNVGMVCPTHATGIARSHMYFPWRNQNWHCRENWQW